jgi:hypothetical protein
MNVYFFKNSSSSALIIDELLKSLEFIDEPPLINNLVVTADYSLTISNTIWSVLGK